MPSREELREITRNKVMAAAEKLFRERGFKSAAIRDIAEEAGVSVGSVIAVGDKRELLVAMFDRSIAQIHQTRSSERAACNEVRTNAGTTENPADKLMRVVAPFLEIFAESPELAREYGAILMSGSHRSEIYQDLGVALVNEIGEALEEIGMPTKDVPVAAKTIYFSYLGAVSALAGTGSSDLGPLQELYSIFTFVTESKGVRQ